MTDTNNIVPTFTQKHKQFLSALLANNDDNKIVAVITGHTHRDGLFLVDDDIVDANTGNTMFVVTTTCDANGFDWDAERITQYRPNGTIKESAFDFVCFDRSKKLLDFIRIGAPANISYQKQGTIEERIIRYESQLVSVGGTLNLESVLGGAVTWTTKNSSIATISNGVVAGISAGHCMIIAQNESNQIEVFKIKVVI